MKNDPVNSPKHYTNSPSGVELVDVIAHLNYCRSNAIKYIFRAGCKDPAKEMEDLKKAQWCINKEISMLEQGRILKQP